MLSRVRSFRAGLDFCQVLTERRFQREGFAWKLIKVRESRAYSVRKSPLALSLLRVDRLHVGA